jgi:regulatory protein
MASSGSTYTRGRSSPEKALQKLKHFCGYQERSPSEVRQKLYSLGLFKKDVEELVARLTEEKYLNEERFATSFASGKSSVKGWGRQKIRFELRRKGVSESFIIKALKSLDVSEYEVSFGRQAEKKWRSLQSEKNIFVKKNKWQQSLLLKGFEPAIIKAWSFPGETEAGSSAD